MTGPTCIAPSYGPSPRGWGNPLGQLLQSPAHRAIPTRVGKSKTPSRNMGGRPGHPHAGGEIQFFSGTWRRLVGPSPRGWGNPEGSSSMTSAQRAIPTRVGKSSRSAAMIRHPAGHPHAGGEILGNAAHPILSSGPSPRGWGNRLDCRFDVRPCRAIPTRVGKSAASSVDTLSQTGHPHAGGEISTWIAPVTGSYGPSPRGWGNP